MRPLLPVEIVERKDKGLNIYAYLAALARESQRLERLFVDARVCAFGYVKPAALKELVELAKTGNSQRSTLLMSLICMEYWLRTLESRVAEFNNPALAQQPCVEGYIPEIRNVAQAPLQTV